MDAFIAAAIHDAKNELSALGVWLGEAQREFSALGAQPSPALAHAMAIASRLSAELVELLALYREGCGSLRLAIADHDLSDFLTDLITDLRRSQAAEKLAAADHAIEIITDFTAAAELQTWAFDAYLVNFALLDALRNGLRHARSRLRLSIGGETGGGIRFDVEDDGPGYPETLLRSETATTMSGASSGLGLTFARLIATHHATPAGRRGSLKLANDGFAAGGAHFTLLLP